jgi:hypothetical protein
VDFSERAEKEERVEAVMEKMSMGELLYLLMFGGETMRLRVEEAC